MARAFTPLRLSALETEDLNPVSAALQDAVAQLGDFDFLARARVFTIGFNRYCWEAEQKKRRVRCGLQIASVLDVRSRNIRRGADEAVVNLLSIGFEAGDAPSGELVLLFSGDGELRLQVECLDLVLADVSDPWSAVSRPSHEREESGS
ncbi:MAG: DUF2948 family protein [Maricaulis sp.]|nr:DUF2948 family protein [Maricaulis sp.]